MSELELHPGAAAEIDRRGNVLLGRLVSRTDDEIREERDFEPDRYISGTISNGEIAEIRSATVDGAGEEVAKYFTEGVSQVGLEDDAYEAFADLAGMIFRTAAFNPYVSRDRIKDVVFDWFRDARRLATRQTLARYLVEACAGEIADYQIAIPIARLSVESPVVVGRATIRPLSGALLDEWLGGAVSEARSDAEREAAEANRVKKLKRLQGLSAAFVDVRAERSRAQEIAHQEAEAATALLRFFSGASLSAKFPCYCVPLGMEAVPAAESIVLLEGTAQYWNEGTMERRPSAEWTLSNEVISETQPRLDAISDLYLNQETDFRQRLLGAFMLYSRVSIVSELTDKLVLATAALESLFLRNQTEPVQQNLAERLALSSRRALEERRDVVKRVRDAYRIRSRFVHHAKRIDAADEMGVIDGFLWAAWIGLFQALNHRDSFRTHKEFLDFIDELKLR